MTVLEAPALTLELVPIAAEEPELFWCANHTHMDLAVRGGWRTVRMLIGSLDGDWWPWTWIAASTARNGPWVQVLGTPEAMTIEIGGFGNALRVGRAGAPSGTPLVLPPECRYWVPKVEGNQSFTADEATAIAREYLTEGWLSQDYDLEHVTSVGGRNG